MSAAHLLSHARATHQLLHRWKHTWRLGHWPVSMRRHKRSQTTAVLEHACREEDRRISAFTATWWGGNKRLTTFCNVGGRQAVVGEGRNKNVGGFMAYVCE